MASADVLMNQAVLHDDSTRKRPRQQDNVQVNVKDKVSVSTTVDIDVVTHDKHGGTAPNLGKAFSRIQSIMNAPFKLDHCFGNKNPDVYRDKCLAQQQVTTMKYIQWLQQQEAIAAAKK